jgi:hypothetical protein
MPRTPNDPIFAIIEQLRTADKAVGVALKIDGDKPDSPKTDQAWADYYDTLHDMTEVRPTTTAGVVALLNYMLQSYQNGEHEFWGSDDNDKPFAYWLVLNAHNALKGIT